jgi:8-oxo-dGTP pyrophosphatase MutT (NUDIX family)
VTVPQRSAGVVVVRRFPEGWRYLVLRAYRNWDFPKGLIEAGETPLEAAVREVREEASLDGLEFRWGDAFSETAPYRGGKVARYYLAESPSGEVFLPVSPALGRPEHHEFRWVDYHEARRLLPPRLSPILEWAHALLAEGRPAGRLDEGSLTP